MDEYKDEKWYPRVLVIGPGGIKGLKILGFLSPLEDAGLLEYVDTYCGVSVGAVISLLLICGYSVREIVGEAVNLDMFRDIGSLDINAIIDNKGFISNEHFRSILTQLIINKFGNVPTLYGLYMMTGKSYIAVTFNVTDEVCVMMNPFTHPNLSCVDATLFSMNIPFVFYQLIYKGKTYVDGLLGNPYPINYFDDGNTKILGIYVKTVNSIPDKTKGVIIEKINQETKDRHLGCLPFGEYSLKIIYSLIDNIRNIGIQQSSDMCKHVCLETKSLNTVGYGVSLDDKAVMLVEGFNQGKKFISDLEKNTYTCPKINIQEKYKYPEYFMMETNNNSDIISTMSNFNSACNDK
jgi:predicted acylesterase/phospholipase RssA